ncbi:quinolinate synthase NadA [Peristeroidobacter soli]|jgi:quinolinate synthase|uniref:quinolinate synthase NadA n=1 Tax=Peristeroidobacter soli TaxID=2497877 RepID=UPI00101D34A6|nr:quinolinate synthase NadA [Peristeroidobacter soli]
MAVDFSHVHYDSAEHTRRYPRVRRAMPREEWDAVYDQVAAIQALKRQHGAMVLAHNYQRPEIFHGVADVQGDSLALARIAAESDAEVFVMCGVHFMAETVKLLAPDRLVLLPDPNAGCSLAESIQAADVRALRARYPGVPAVCYVNTSAAVKAECDACCTSANAIQVVQSLGSPEVIFVPDEYLAAYVAANTSVRIIPWLGRCEVHERFTGEQIREYRQTTDAFVLAHPECPVDVQEAADFVGSTAGMIAALDRRRPERAVLITECSMSDNISSEFPGTQFLRPCNLCPHMQRVNLANIRACLESLSPAVEVPADVADGARRAVQRMLSLSGRPS